MADKPVQHTPVHLRPDTPEVFDSRHPAASAFAPVQPGAGVVAEDVEEKGQNLAGGPKASDAEKQYSATDEVVLAHQGQAGPASTEAGGELKQPVDTRVEPKPVAKKAAASDK